MNDVQAVYDTLKWAAGIAAPIIMAFLVWLARWQAHIEKTLEDRLTRMDTEFTAINRQVFDELNKQATRAADYREQIAGRMVTKEDLAEMERRIIDQMGRKEALFPQPRR
jgi:hypothetical protein